MNKLISTTALNNKTKLINFNKKNEILQKICKVEEQESIDKGAICRICLEGDSEQDPFVNIFECSKHMPSHLNCVKQWLSTKVQTKNHNEVYYCNLQEIKCELYKSDYLATIVYIGKEYSLLDFKLDKNRPNLMLDICDKNTGANKSFVVVYFENNKS